MPGLNASDLLNLWERAYSLSPPYQAIEIARAANPRYTWTEVAQWPIGFRDRQIARLRSDLFGPRVTSAVNCSSCSNPIEFNVDLGECFQLTLAEPPNQAEVSRPRGIRSARPLSTADVLLCLSHQGDPQELLARCVDWEGDGIPETERLSIATEYLEQLDPEARIEFSLQCPDCGQCWSSLFDIANICWIELSAWARRTMQDIHQLASRYGWSEEQILQVSPWRRAVYLHMTGTR